MHEQCRMKKRANSRPDDEQMRAIDGRRRKTMDKRTDGRTKGVNK